MDADIYVVGLGPGAENQITPMAKSALQSCQVIVGYDVYMGLIQPLIDGKKQIKTAMRKEVERCQAAIEEALAGNKVAVVGSGDAGIYGLAGLVYELAAPHPHLKIEVISGLTAASTTAALLGAPLIHDFAVISLSDLLTPWEKIEKRLLLTSEADFVICLYNPRSHKRHEHLLKACDLMLQSKAPQTPCGYAKQVGRELEETRICTLAALRDDHNEVDMFTTLIIGNSQTTVINGKLVTPRGYKIP